MAKPEPSVEDRTPDDCVKETHDAEIPHVAPEDKLLNDICMAILDNMGRCGVRGV